jgi:hypothetical protein
VGEGYCGWKDGEGICGFAVVVWGAGCSAVNPIPPALTSIPLPSVFVFVFVFVLVFVLVVALVFMAVVGLPVASVPACDAVGTTALWLFSFLSALPFAVLPLSDLPPSSRKLLYDGKS